MSYRCTRCGKDGAAAPAHPSLDDRYAVGYCSGACTPVPETIAGYTPPRPTVQLIRDDLFDPQALNEPRRQRRRSQLMRKCVDGRPMTDAERAEAEAVFAEVWADR